MYKNKIAFQACSICVLSFSELYCFSQINPNLNIIVALLLCHLYK